MKIKYVAYILTVTRHEGGWYFVHYNHLGTQRDLWYMRKHMYWSVESWNGQTVYVQSPNIEREYLPCLARRYREGLTDGSVSDYRLDCSNDEYPCEG